jgi:hypothetical protein
MMTLCFMPLSIALGAALNTKKSSNAIAQYSNLSDNFFIVGKARNTCYFENSE